MILKDKNGICMVKNSNQMKFTNSELYTIRAALYQVVDQQSEQNLDDNDPEVIKIEKLLDKIETALNIPLEQGT